MYTQYHDSSPIQSSKNCIKSHNNTYMCTYIFRFLVGRYNICEFTVHCLYRKYKEAEGEFLWIINLLGFIRVSELFMGVA